MLAVDGVESTESLRAGDAVDLRSQTHLQLLDGRLGGSAVLGVDSAGIETETRETALEGEHIIACEDLDGVETEYTVTELETGTIKLCERLRAEHTVAEDPPGLLELPNGEFERPIEVLAAGISDIETQTRHLRFDRRQDL
ncbi:hypothetical protein GCM10009700_05770 [Brevibacterium sanguinis]